MTANRIRACCLPREVVCTAAASRPGMPVMAARPATAPADALTRSLRVSLSMSALQKGSARRGEHERAAWRLSEAARRVSSALRCRAWASRDKDYARAGLSAGAAAGDRQLCRHEEDAIDPAP